MRHQTRSLPIGIRARQWDIYLPTVVRYLPSLYVDEFFDSGKLRLSSFRAFREREHAQKGDLLEGRSLAFGVGKSGTDGQTFTAIFDVESGLDCYVMSTSLVDCPTLNTAFESDSGIRIINTLEFAQRVAEALPFFMGGKEGYCLYRKERYLDASVSPALIDAMRDGTEVEVMAQRAQEEIVSNDLLFLKDASYRSQAEYRLLWIVRLPPVDFIDIVVPEARDFCERLKR